MSKSMKVRNLIAILSSFDPEKSVRVNRSIGNKKITQDIMTVQEDIEEDEVVIYVKSRPAIDTVIKRTNTPTCNFCNCAIDRTSGFCKNENCPGREAREEDEITEEQIKKALGKGKKEADAFLEACRLKGFFK